MRGYFKMMADAFPYQELDRLYYKHVMESLGAEMDEFLEPLLSAITSSYVVRLNGHLSMIYIAGSVQMMEWAGVPYEGPPIEAAIKYATERAGWLIKNMDKETISQLRKVISDGIANKRGIPGLTSDLRKEFSTMSKYRAQMIARTETSDALGKSFMDRVEEMGIEGKEWIWPGGECEICEENEAAGVIRIDEAFPSGHMHPPAHPNCECALAPARLT